MSLIDEITDVEVTAFLSLPPRYLFHITGQVTISHWKSVSLLEVVHIVPPADRIQEFTVEIELADDSIPTDTMQPVEVTSSIMFLADWTVGIRFIAARNNFEKHLGGPHKRFEIDVLQLTEMTTDSSAISLMDHPAPWPWKKVIRQDKDNNPMPLPFAFSEDDLSQSVCQFLIGRKLRVLKPGDVGTTDIDPGRVTIQLADSGRIDAVQIDPDLPAL